jgi:ribosomal-protein-alanine N-acetyltransferase
VKYLLEGEQSQRLYFRKVDLSDYKEWLEFFKDPASFAHWQYDRKTAEQDCSDWYDKQFGRYRTDRGGMNALIEKTTGLLIGHCGLLVQQVDNQTELEIGYSLLPRGRHKGYATEAAIKCKDFAFRNDFAESLISIISTSNKPSMNVARKNGMKHDKQTVYGDNDVFIFRIQKADWLNNDEV